GHECVCRCFIGREGDEGPVVPLFHRLSCLRHEPRANLFAAFGRRSDVDGPPGHAPSASLSLDQKPGERRGGSPSSLASSRKSRSCSSLSRSGVQTCSRMSKSPFPFWPSTGRPRPLRRMTVSG